jgi:hypothetical protein
MNEIKKYGVSWCGFRRKAKLIGDAITSATMYRHLARASCQSLVCRILIEFHQVRVRYERRPIMKLITIITTAMTRRAWINPPSVYEVISPTAQRTMRIIAIVQSMVAPPLVDYFTQSICY